MRETQRQRDDREPDKQGQLSDTVDAVASVVLDDPLEAWLRKNCGSSRGPVRAP
jgi:hypothetical protein